MKVIIQRTEILNSVPIWRIVALILFVAVWTTISAIIDSNLFPSPWATVLAAGKIFTDGSLFEAVGQSILVYLAGYLLAILIAVPFGLFMGAFWRPKSRRLFDVVL